jgi:hypothetical protein
MNLSKPTSYKLWPTPNLQDYVPRTAKEEKELSRSYPQGEWEVWGVMGGVGWGGGGWGC